MVAGSQLGGVNLTFDTLIGSFLIAIEEIGQAEFTPANPWTVDRRLVDFKEITDLLNSTEP